MVDVDPRHQSLDWLRQHMPVFRDEASGCFFLTRYADVRSCLSDRHLKNSDLAEPGTFLEKAGRPVNPSRPDERDTSMGYLDDPDHDRVRRPIAQALAARFVVCRPMVEGVVSKRLDMLAARDVFDVVADFAAPIPLEANAVMIGVERSDLPWFRDWTLAGFKIFQTERTEAETSTMNDALESFASYFERLIEKRRAEPRDDLLTDLLAAQAAGAPISDLEIRGNCVSLVAASIMTTTDLISAAIWLLLTHPEEMAKLTREPELVKAVIEESLRVEPPVESEWRIMSRDVEIGECPVRRGQVVSMSLLAANRDPAVFADPHQFDISREQRPIMSFGGGEHICIGAPFGRLVGQLAVGGFFERFPDIRLPDPEAPVKRRQATYFPGLMELMVARTLQRRRA